MSREERKMAQIIASIERMEQRKAAPVAALATRADASSESTDEVGGVASSGSTGSGAPAGTAESPAATERANSGEIHAQTQKVVRLGAKGRRLKPLSTSHGAKVKARGGSRGAKTPQELVVSKSADCRLTPKKRWIQLWNEQLSSLDETSGAGEKKAEADASLASPSPPIDEQKETSISPVPSVKESLKETPTAHKKIEERVASVEAPDDTKPAATTPTVESQSSSATARSDIAEPPLPTAIPTASAAAAVAIKANGGADDAKHPSEVKSVVETTLLGRESGDRSRKRSLERKDSEPLTEEERRRAERRRLRKSNWDVGDPRFGIRNGEKQAVRSPTSDDIALSSKFPPGRPAWRHSNSMDATYSSKSGFPTSSSLHRSSFSGGGSGGNGVGGAGPSRRPFYSSNSLPLDRSRSAGRSSSGYHHR